MSMKWYLVVVICISWFALSNDGEHLFVHLLAIFRFSLERFISFTYFIFGLFIFLLLSGKTLRILGTRTFIRYIICKYFLPFCEPSFHSFDSVLGCTKISNFDEGKYIHFSFLLLMFSVLHLSLYCQIQDCEDFLLSFLLRILNLPLTFRSFLS